MCRVLNFARPKREVRKPTNGVTDSVIPVPLSVSGFYLLSINRFRYLLFKDATWACLIGGKLMVSC